MKTKKTNYNYEDEDFLEKKNKKSYEEEDDFNIDLNSLKGKPISEVIKQLKESEII